jgi:GH24 family phage-related lysozyme (muramidase)
MDIALIKKWIKRWESIRYQAYDDATGHRVTPGIIIQGKAHIGIGFDLEAPGAYGIVSSMHLDYAAIRNGITSITIGQVEQLFNTTFDQAVTGARGLVPNFDELPDDKQLVLVDLVFNLGRYGFSKFAITLQHVIAQEWTLAAVALKISAWFHQVGQRGTADVAVLEGAFSPLHYV